MVFFLVAAVFLKGDKCGDQICATKGGLEGLWMRQLLPRPMKRYQIQFQVHEYNSVELSKKSRSGCLSHIEPLRTQSELKHWLITKTMKEKCI